MKRVAILLMALALLGGCTKRKEAAHNDLVDAYKLLDAGRDDEAIASLEKLHSDDPKDNNVTVALASGYAAKAGLQIYSFYDLFYEAMFSKPWAELAKGKAVGGGVPNMQAGANAAKPKTPAETMNAALDSFSRALGALIQIAGVLEKLPAVSEENRPYLEQALILLDSLDKVEKPHAVFRVLLRSTFLKNYLAVQFAGDAKSNVLRTDPSGHCEFQSSGLAATTDEVTKILGKIMGDLAIGFPKDKPTFASAEASIKEANATMKATLSGATSLQNEKDINTTLGQVWGCGK